MNGQTFSQDPRKQGKSHHDKKFIIPYKLTDLSFSQSLMRVKRWQNADHSFCIAGAEEDQAKK